VSDAQPDLSKFLAHYSAPARAPSDDVDLFDGLGIDGDEAFEFMDSFAARFGVDTSGYRWYFHHGEEGWNFGGLFVRPPYARVKRIPITAGILGAAIETRKWPIRYPEHVLPPVRWDIRLNQLLILLPLIALALWVWSEWVR
jgi:hypothetical protein